jgi:hypothetical protein
MILKNLKIYFFIKISFFVLFHNYAIALITADIIEKNIITNDKKISNNLKKVLNLTSIYPKDDSITEALHWIDGTYDSQYSWIRNDKTERWEIERNINISDDNLDDIIKIINENIGFKKEVAPINKNYNAILFLGSTLDRVRDRLAYLNQNIDDGKINPTMTYLIGGERVLSEKIYETKEELFNKKNGLISFNNDYKIPRILPELKDEREMLKLVFSQSLHPLLKNKIAIVFIEKEANQNRSFLKNKLKYFFNEYSWNFKDGKYLLISHQPFVLYQKLIVEKVCKEEKDKCQGLEFESIGSCSKETIHSVVEKRKYVSRLLDTLGRTVLLISQK